MQPLRTYIVEDSPVIRENLVAALEELTPVRVVGTSEDESTALNWFDSSSGSGSVGLIIVDIFLKSGSGLGVIRGVRERGMRARLVVLSNYATSDMRQRCESLGADRVFDKSSEIDALIAYCSQLASDTCAETV
jgi:DNA-binding NarL/FixJ family response regulator